MPLVVSAFLGALLSVLIGLLAGVVLPSAELRETQALRVSLEPLVEEARNAYPNLTTSAAIEALRRDLEAVSQLATRSDFRPFSEDLIAQLRKRLRLIDSTGVHIRFVAVEGSASRRELAAELRNQLSRTGFRSTSAAMTVISTGPPRDILVRHGKEQAGLARELIDALRVAVTGHVIAGKGGAGRIIRPWDLTAFLQRGQVGLARPFQCVKWRDSCCRATKTQKSRIRATKNSLMWRNPP